MTSRPVGAAGAYMGSETVAPRLTPDQEANIRRYVARLGQGVPDDDARLLLGEIGALRGELEQAEKRRDRAESKAAILSRQVDRYLPCPDHRDKVDGQCYVCRFEATQRHASRVEEIARERADALNNYGIHKHFCAVWLGGPAGCNCGLADAVASAPAGR